MVTPLSVLGATDVVELWSIVAGGGRARRTAALALARCGDDTALDALLSHPDAEVRRAATWAAGPARIGPRRARALLEDADPLVVEAACWVLGELTAVEAVEALVAVARDHTDARCRESAVAALGAIGDLRGLDAVIAAALGDKPAVRRRAAVALCGFEDPRAEEALVACAGDRDRQVRSVASDLLRERGLDPGGDSR